MSIDLTQMGSNITPPRTSFTIHHEPYAFISSQKFTNSLRGKVVLITGASRGIGRSTALAFAAAGASVALLARSAGPLSSLVAEITSTYDTPVLSIVGDVLTSSISIVSEIESQLGKIDILINNAGAYRLRPFTSEDASAGDLEKWWNVFEVNIKAPISLLHACLPTFIERGQGIVITVGSMAADMQIPFFSAYAGSKASIMRVIELLDLELRSKGVLNFLIHPGQVKTAMSAGKGKEGEELAVGKEMKDLTDSLQEYLVDEPELAAWSMVALAVTAGDGEGRDERVEGLSGRYFDVTNDLEEVLGRIGDIEEKDLYKLKIGRL